MFSPEDTALGVRIREIENVLFCRPAFIRRFDVNVVVQFYPWFKFSFILFLDMVMYDKNKNKRKFKPGIKLNHNISNIIVKNKKNCQRC